MTFKASFVCKSNKICLLLNCESVCVCLCLSQDGAFSVFASDRLFFVSRTSQNIESAMEMLQQKFKDLPGSSLEKLKKLHSEVSEVKSKLGTIGGIF